MIDRSLGAAASGIETMQTELDTIGNNIANSETVGFKSGTAEFQNLLSDVLTPAGAAGANSGSAPCPRWRCSTCRGTSAPTAC